MDLHSRHDQYMIWSDVYRCEGFITVEEATEKISTREKQGNQPAASSAVEISFMVGRC
jgi:hypothetical protein